MPVATGVSVKPSGGGETGFVVEDLGPLAADAAVQLDQSTTIRHGATRSPSTTAISSFSVGRSTLSESTATQVVGSR